MFCQDTPKGHSPNPNLRQGEGDSIPLSIPIFAAIESRLRI